MNPRNLSEEVSGTDANPDPKETSKYAFGEVFPEWHRIHTGNKWCNGSDDGDKSSHDDGFAPMFFVKRLSSGEPMGIKKFSFKKKPFAKEFAAMKVHCITENGSEWEPEKKKWEGKAFAWMGEETSGKKKRVAGQEWHDDNPCFHEEYCKKKSVGEESVLGDQDLKLLVDVKDEVDEIAHWPTR